MQSQETDSEATGADWSVDSLLLAPTAVEIIPCLELATADDTRSKHVQSTPFQNGLSSVWPVVSQDGRTYTGGSLEPPVDEYCEVRVLLVPLDDDAVRGDEFPQLAGLTLYFEGQGAEATPQKTVESSLRADARIQLEQAPVVLDSPSELRLEIDVSTLLESVDPGESDDDVARDMLTSFPQALSATLEPLQVDE